MQKNATSLQTSGSRKAAWLLVLYAFCCFHHELVDAAHFLGHLLEHHHHEHGHHHATYHEQTSHTTLHEHESSGHSHPILALFDWDDEQDNPENTNSSSNEVRKQIDQHIGIMLATTKPSLVDSYSRRYFLVKIIRSLNHVSISSPPPEQYT